MADEIAWVQRGSQWEGALGHYDVVVGKSDKLGAVHITIYYTKRGTEVARAHLDTENATIGKRVAEAMIRALGET